MLYSESFANIRSQIRLVATDMDGTLTQAGKFTPQLLAHLQRLQGAGMPVVIVTGRSAGWVSGLLNYLPVAGAIAENGSLYFSQPEADPAVLVSIPSVADHRQSLQAMFEVLQEQYPHLQPAADNAYRITDWTFTVAGLTQSQIDACAATCREAGWDFTYSNVQCHIKPRLDKAEGLLQVLRQYFPQVLLEQVITVGDSPNDESLFNRQVFAHSVGVANILHYQERLQHFPAYVTQQEEALGFGELCQLLLPDAL